MNSVFNALSIPIIQDIDELHQCILDWVNSYEWVHDIRILHTKGLYATTITIMIVHRHNYLNCEKIKIRFDQYFMHIKCFVEPTNVDVILDGFRHAFEWTINSLEPYIK